MGKYSLGKSTTVMNEKLVKDGIFLNEAKAEPIVNNILKELDDISKSLQKINILLNSSVSMGIVKGSRGVTFKSWAKKSKEQANNALKLGDKVSSKYNRDVKDYPIKLLDERIAELERKIEELSN